ncbi:MAG: hypothetical protein DRG78_13660 [Epsilonproteobacteria bacterium]|nr:MAG: hypothetical protein DRG78_13660 [Campylobacterota bacterium]
MAKKKKISTNKSKGIESISRNQSSDYKLISGWLLGLHNNDISEALENIPNYKYKFYVNLLNNPKIIFYLNEYMNDLFWFNKFSLMDWAKTFRLIMQHHGVTQTNQLFFSRYKKDEKVEFITLISEYVTDFGLDPLNNVEISHLYHLYNEDIIDEQDLEEIKFLLDKPSKLKKTKPVKQDLAVFEKFNKDEEVIIDLVDSDEMISTKSNFKSFINNRNVCKTCKLRGTDPLMFDTTASKVGPVDLMIIGTFPSATDVSNNKAFSDENGKFVRFFIDRLIKETNISVVYTYSYVCSPKNMSSSAAERRKLINNCSGVLSELTNAFKPKLKLVLDIANAKMMFDIKGPAAKLIGTTINDNSILCISPADVISNEKKLPIFKSVMDELHTFFNQNKRMTNTTSNTNISDVSETNLSKQKLSSLTLFDIKTVYDKLIYIYIDPTGKKVYVNEEIKFPIFIKYGDYSECDYFITDIDGVCIVDSKQKNKLIYQLNKNVKAFTGSDSN